MTLCKRQEGHVRSETHLLTLLPQKPEPSPCLRLPEKDCSHFRPLAIDLQSGLVIVNKGGLPTLTLNGVGVGSPFLCRKLSVGILQKALILYIHRLGAAMRKKRALLIQDMSGLMNLVQPCFTQAVEAFVHFDAEPEAAWKWILEKELDLIYGLVSKDHDRYNEPYLTIHSYLDQLLKASLSQVVAANLGAPISDYDHTVDLEIRGKDLYIHYTPSWNSLLELRTYIKHLRHG